MDCKDHGDWIKSGTMMEAEGIRQKGCLRKTWSDAEKVLVHHEKMHGSTSKDCLAGNK